MFGLILLLNYWMATKNRRRHTAETRNRAPKNRSMRDFWEEEKPRQKRAADKVRREEPAEGDDEVPSAERRGFCPSREPTRGNSQLRYANRRARVVQLNSSASKKGHGENHVPFLAQKAGFEPALRFPVLLP